MDYDFIGFFFLQDWGSSGSCLLDGMESLLQTEARIDTERMDQLLLVTVLLEEAGDQESSRKQRKDFLFHQNGIEPVR